MPPAQSPPSRKTRSRRSAEGRSRGAGSTSPLAIEVAPSVSNKLRNEKSRTEVRLSDGGEPRSARIVFDDQIGLHRHRIGYVGRLRRADEPAPHAVVVDLDIIGDVAFAGLRRLEDERHPFRLRREFDRVAVANRVGRNIHAPTVDEDMPVIDQLTRGERCGHQLHAVNDGVEAALEQLDQIVAGIAAPPVRFFIKSAELTLADIGVITLELLLGGELRSEVGRLLAALTVLAGAVFAAIERALRAAPQIYPETAIDLVFRFLTPAAHKTQFQCREPRH